MSYCDHAFPNNIYESYTTSWGGVFEIWECTNTYFDGTQIVHRLLYYEKTHPETSWQTGVEEVRLWIENNLAPVYANVTISVIGEGSTDPVVGNYSDTWFVGDILSVTAMPASGWKYELMNRNGVEWTRANPGEFLNLQSTDAIEVVFVKEVEPPPRRNWLPFLVLVPIIGGVIYWFTRRK